MLVYVVQYNATLCCAHPVLRVTDAWDKEGHTRWLHSSPRGSSSALRCTAVDAAGTRTGTAGGVMLTCVIDIPPAPAPVPVEPSLLYFFFTFTLLCSLWLHMLLQVRTKSSTSSRTFWKVFLPSTLSKLSIQSTTVTLISVLLFSLKHCLRWNRIQDKYYSENNWKAGSSIAHMEHPHIQNHGFVKLS